MITADDTEFPANAISLIATASAGLDSDLFVAKRPLRESDPNQSIGVYASMWLPDENSYEMRGRPDGIHEPTLQSYTIGVQAFVKDMDAERGLVVHATLSKMVRRLLYRDDTLRLGLRALQVTVDGSTERTQRFGVRSQRYVSNELQGTWLYLSTIEVFLETETS